MACPETRHGMEVYRIAAADGSAEARLVPGMGAAMESLRLPGRRGLQETLYLHPFFWDPASERTRGGFPFIFPICGRLERGGELGAYLYEARVRRMSNHGFSMRQPWTVRDASAPDALTLTLRDSETTREQYPFSFELALTYRVRAGMLTVEQEYRNTGSVPLPYYAGFHPYYLTPPPGAGKEKVMLQGRPERQLVYNDRLTDAVGTAPPPVLPISVSDPLINERLTRVGADKEFRLVLPEGVVLHSVAEGREDPDLFPYVQFYTMPDRPFFCVEPWMSFPNALNTAKGCRWLAPGQAEYGALKVWTTVTG